MTSRAFAHAVFLSLSAVESTGGNLFCVNSYFLHYYFFFIGYMFDDARLVQAGCVPVIIKICECDDSKHHTLRQSLDAGDALR